MKWVSMVRACALLLVVAATLGVVAWPTDYRLGWALSIFGREVPPLGEEPRAVGAYLLDLATVWWGGVNSHPPGSAVEWVAVVALSALATGALGIVVAKSLIAALGAAAALGAVGGAVIGMWLKGAPEAEAWIAMLAVIARRLGRRWAADFLIVLAAVLALDAVTLALRVHG